VPAFSLTDHPHRRLNALTGEWVLVSPHRTRRPWSGQVEDVPPDDRPEHDPKCYLCPRNTRADGSVNDDYAATYVFDNDFAALLPDTPDGEVRDGDLLLASAEQGLCRVICFSPRHDLTLAQMTPEQILPVVNVWAQQTAEIGARSEIGYVQVFENKGAMMGCSNPHPHGQIWASESIPNEPAKEIHHMARYHEARRTCLLCDYAALELAEVERVVLENAHWVAVVPFWAVWPFETMLLPKRHVVSLPGLHDAERDALADAMHRLTARYDALFGVSFPYSMGFHQSPFDGRAHPEAHLHAHYYPTMNFRTVAERSNGG